MKARRHQPVSLAMSLALALAGVLSCLVSPAAVAQNPVELPEVGHSQPIEVVPDLSRAQSTERGLVWHHTVRVPGATFLKPHFEDFDLGPNEMLVVRSARGRVVEEITGRGPKEWGAFWGLSAFGDTLDLELSFSRRRTTLPFRIDQISVGNENLFNQQANGPESICSPGDFEDAICYQADGGKWANVVASVGVMSAGNMGPSLFCSGSNVSQNNRILTNFHCIGSQAECNNAEFVFKYYRTDCGIGAPPTADWVGFRCDELLASSPLISCESSLADLDFSLHSVIGDPASTFGWVEPDPTPLVDGEAIYIVQHPAGRPHEVTHGSGANVDVDGTVLRYYDTLDTEGGSSGSPIYREADDKLVGLHHCGGCSTPGIGNRGMLMSDIYPLIQPFLVTLEEIFSGGFETGDFSQWTLSVTEPDPLAGPPSL